MLTLNDGRNELWQWDTGRKLTVDADCSQVHFSNKVFGRSIDVDVVDGTAAIPDVLLQVDNELIAWAFVGTPENGYTKISKVFKVNKRNKPADYVFTPPEQTTLGQIMKRLDRIEESQDHDAIKNAVDDYLANNPIQIDEKDPTVPSWAKQPQKPSYSAQEVGAESAGTAAAAVSGHNTSADAHNDLRLELKAISNRLNAFFDSDDQTLDELSEIVAYITSNKSLIDAITTSKVSVSDIVDNLTTNTGNRPLSAAQGVVLKGLIDTVSRSLSNYQPKGDYLGREELPAAVNDALAQAKASGEFKGDPGTPGKDGAAGKDGYTPTKGIDYDDGVGIDYFKQTVKSDVDGGTNRFDLLLTNGHPETFYIKNGTKGTPGPKGDAGKTAYEYAKDGGYTGTEAQFAAKLATEFPTKLPNPNALTIDGKSYDGSAPVAVEFPNKLPNPKALTVDGKTYDGSAPVDVQLPTKLPNPNALVINGKRYDGTEFVNMNIEGNVVSNWLAKSGQPGHILFRPFYEVPEVTLADNVEVTSGYYNWINYKAVADYEKVTVDYDGTTYICPITFQESHSPELGDESFFYIGNLNGDAPEYPFSIVGYRNNDVSSIVVGSGAHTLSVKLEAFVKKIDPKFLPDDDDGEIVNWDILPKAKYTLNAEYAGVDFDEEVKPLVVGKTYIISINGVEYEREAKFYESDGWEQTYIGSIFGDPAYETDDEFSFYTFDTGGGGLTMKPDYANKTIELGVREKTENSGTGDSGSSGGVSSWNDLTDKPFDSVISDPVFDGDMTGRDTVLADANTGAYAVKISDQVVSVYELVGATLKLDMGGTEQPIVLTDAMVMDASLVLGVSGAVVLQGTDPIVLSLPEDGVIQGAFFRAGTWFMCIPGAFHVKSVSCLYPSENVTKKVAAKFIDAEWMAAPTEGVIASRYTTFKSGNGAWENNGSAEAVTIPTSEVHFDSYYDFYIGEKKYAAKCIDPSIIAPDIAELGFVASFVDDATLSNQPGFFAHMGTNGTLMIHCPEETLGRLLVRIVSKGIIVPMPEKYMPILTSPSGKKFKITVDDNGTITATEVT